MIVSDNNELVKRDFESWAKLKGHSVKWYIDQYDSQKVQWMYEAWVAALPSTESCCNCKEGVVMRSLPITIEGIAGEQVHVDDTEPLPQRCSCPCHAPSTERVSISRVCVAYCLELCEKTHEKLSIVSINESYMKALAFVIAELSRALEAADE